MSCYAPLLAALVALLAGLTIGKAWERYKLRDGTWIDRRRARESPHYILGLNFLVANQIDLAIEELSKAASLDGDALEVHMILGNLYREKGQVGKAITRAPDAAAAAEPQQARARLRAALPRASTTSAAASSTARSRRSTKCCGSIRRTSTRCSTCRSCTKSSISGPRRTTRGSASSKLADIDARPQSQAILAFLENEIGLEAVRRKDYAEAIRRFEAAIDLDARAVPAYLNLGDVRVRAGQRARGGRRSGSGSIERRAGPRLPRVRSARGAGDPHAARRIASRACAGG